jgi:hypothetical protein
MKQGSHGLLIALTAGGTAEELAAHGLGVEHIDELMVRLAMRLLRVGHRLGFGGSLDVQRKQLTEVLIETVQSWLDEATAQRADVNQPETWPLSNWSAWPFHRMISDELRAELVGSCRIVDVNPSGVRKVSLDAAYPDWEENPRARLYAADGLSAMRKRSAQEADLRIVWGGKIAGSIGWMPGILEEVALSLAIGKPVVVLGGFGGCSNLLADFLAKKNARWPDRLAPAASADPERDKLCSESKRKELNRHFQQAKKSLLDFRSRLHSEESVHGLPSNLLNKALHEENARRAVHLVAAAAHQLS